jgi:hypothetical protein
VIAVVDYGACSVVCLVQRLVEQTGYRDKVLGAMPQLAILDGRRIEGAQDGGKKKKKGAKHGDKTGDKAGRPEAAHAGKNDSGSKVGINIKSCTYTHTDTSIDTQALGLCFMLMRPTWQRD